MILFLYFIQNTKMLSCELTQIVSLYLPRNYSTNLLLALCELDLNDKYYLLNHWHKNTIYRKKIFGSNVETNPYWHKYEVYIYYLEYIDALRSSYSDYYYHGLKKDTHYNGYRTETLYYCGKKRYTIKLDNRGQLISETNYLNDIPHGLYVSYDGDGHLFERVNYYHGRFKGVYQRWHGKTLILESNHRNGYMHGLRRSWNYKGNLTDSRNYYYGMRINQIIFWSAVIIADCSAMYYYFRKMLTS